MLGVAADFLLLPVAGHALSLACCQICTSFCLLVRTRPPGSGLGDVLPPHPRECPSSKPAGASERARRRDRFLSCFRGRGWLVGTLEGSLTVKVAPNRSLPHGLAWGHTLCDLAQLPPCRPPAPRKSLFLPDTLLSFACIPCVHSHVCLGRVWHRKIFLDLEDDHCGFTSVPVFSPDQVTHAHGLVVCIIRLVGILSGSVALLWAPSWPLGVNYKHGDGKDKEQTGLECVS